MAIESRAPGDGAIVGVADHAGWAVLVTAARDGTLLDRRRVVLLDEGLPSLAYHHDAQALPLEEAVELIERVRASAGRHAKLALDALALSVASPILGIALRQCPPLPPTIAGRLADYRAQNVADTVMFRQALAGAAEGRGWAVHWYNAKKVLETAEGVDLRRAIGPPWGQDHKIAMAAAMAAAGRP